MQKTTREQRIEMEEWAEAHGHATASVASRPGSSRPRIECECGKAFESGRDFGAAQSALNRHRRDVAAAREAA